MAKIDITNSLKQVYPEEPVKDELWVLEGWLNNIRQTAHQTRTNLEALIAQEKLVENIIKTWKTIKK